MKKKELGITEGEVKIDRKGGWIETADGRLICECTHCNYQSDANLVFIANAFNTANKCGLLPSELLKQRDELLFRLKDMCYYHEVNSSWDKGNNGYYKAKATINQLEQ